MSKQQILTAVLLACTALGATEICLAQGFPSKPIRMIVTYPAGAASDTLARIIAQKMSESWGQQVIIDNRPGGNTVIGTGLATKANPDGHTLLMGQAQNLAIVPALYSKLPYDTARDLSMITFIGYAPLILVVTPSLPVKSVKELIDLLKSKPGQLKFPSSGSGGSTHLAAELFKSLTGTDMIHVPYQGGAAPLLALMNGQVEVGFDSIVQTLPHVRSGKLRVLGITSSRRSPAANDIPTVAEAGVPGFEVAPWFGVAAPAGTPDEVVAKLNAEVNRIIRLNDVHERLSGMGVETVGGTPIQFTTHLRSELVKWTKVVRDAGARID